MIPLSAKSSLFFILALLFAIPIAGIAQQGTREAMADAMSRMMEAMGLFDSGASAANRAHSSLGMPWGMPMQGLSPTPEMRELMSQLGRGMSLPGGNSGNLPRPWNPSPLEGIWEGRNGELLIIQGDRFRIYSPTMQAVNGLISVRGDRLALYNPQDGQARPFEFAESEGRLVMRDLQQQHYLYRRLRLDHGHERSARSAHSSP